MNPCKSDLNCEAWNKTLSAIAGKVNAQASAKKAAGQYRGEFIGALRTITSTLTDFNFDKRLVPSADKTFFQTGIGDISTPDYEKFVERVGKMVDACDFKNAQANDVGQLMNRLYEPLRQLAVQENPSSEKMVADDAGLNTRPIAA